MVGRVPVARGKHRQAGRGKHGDGRVERRNDLVAAGHGKLATGQEIVLNIDNEEGVARTGGRGVHRRFDRAPAGLFNAGARPRTLTVRKRASGRGGLYW
jgi:hypothetical protein